MPTQCDDFIQYVPDYCLGTLDPVLHADVDALLPDCPELQALVEAYQVLAEPLLVGVPPATVPAVVFENLMAATSSRPSKFIRLTQRIPHWAAVAVLLLAFLVASNLLWLQRTNHLLNQLDNLSATETANPQLGNDGYTIQNNGIIGNNLAQMPIAIAMNSGPTMSQLNNYSAMNPVNQFVTSNAQSQIVVTWSKAALSNTWIGVLNAQNFAVQAPEMDYQLWLNDNDAGTSTSAGIFDVDSFGNGILVFEVEQPVDAFDEISVTSEPIGGSLQPTGIVVLQTNIQNWTTFPE